MTIPADTDVMPDCQTATGALPQHLRLLLIDDDEVDRMAVVRALKQAPMSLDISQTATAAEGLHMAASGHFDAIFLDYRLPDQDGLGVLQCLCSEQYDPVTVIMLSNNEDATLSSRCLEAGAQDFLLKDEVNSRRLTRALQQAKQRHSIMLHMRNHHDHLRMLAECDPLTGLFNRRGFEMALAKAINLARRSDAVLALFLLDLDDFKSVNDNYGHDCGDQLLIQIARRLSHEVRDGDFVCRLGGDEFVVLTLNLECDEHAAFMAERLLGSFKTPFSIDDQTLNTAASIGIAFLNDSVEDAAELIRHADIAMYQAKQDGRNQARFYCEKLHQWVQRATTLKQDVQHALADNQFQLHYLPQLRASDGSLCGIDVNIQWHHPTLGTLQPQEFLPMIDAGNTLFDLGNWTLCRLARQFQAWHTQYPARMRELMLSTRLYPAQLRDRGMLRLLDQTLLRSGLDASRLTLTILEDDLCHDTDSTIGVLKSLQARGIHLQLDQFGAGIAPLQQIHMLPIDSIKLSAHLLANDTAPGKQRQMLLALIRFGQTLDLKITVTSVESDEHRQFCCEQGCDLIQGPYCGALLNADDFEQQWLNKT